MPAGLEVHNQPGHPRARRRVLTGGKYSPLMLQPRVMLICTYRSNCEELLCIICAASLLSGSSGLGACRGGMWVGMETVSEVRCAVVRFPW